MKLKAICVLMAVGLAACGGTKDQPSLDNVAEAMQEVYNEMFPPVLRQRLELQSYEKLTYRCEDLEGNVKRVKCELGGKVTVVGYINGVQTAEGPYEGPPEFDLTFEKRGEDRWVATEIHEKG